MSEGRGTVRVGDRVRWREGYPSDFTAAERDRLGDVVALDVWSGTSVAVVEWFGTTRHDHVPAWGLEVLT